MPLSFGVTFDYRCPFARNAHEHLVQGLKDGADWDVQFLPFSLSQNKVDEGATSGFMAATLLATARPKSRPLWFALAAVVASSRVHVKIHHASDVAAGALIGVGLGKIVRKIWPL